MTDPKPPSVPVAVDKTATALKETLSKPAIRGLALDVLARLSARQNADWVPPKGSIQALTRALCARYPYAAQAQIDRLLKAGVPLERIYHGYLATAARELGARWDRSESSLDEVSTAMLRLYVIICDVRDRLPPPSAGESQTQRLVFATVPGDGHILGTEMATDLFRRNGWDVAHLVDADHHDILETARDREVALVGLSASSKRHRAAVLRLVVALRIMRPELKIILAGVYAQHVPDLIDQSGIDWILREGEDPVGVVTALLTAPSAARGTA